MDFKLSELTMDKRNEMDLNGLQWTVNSNEAFECFWTKLETKKLQQKIGTTHFTEIKWKWNFSRLCEWMGKIFFRSFFLLYLLIICFSFNNSIDWEWNHWGQNEVYFHFHVLMIRLLFTFVVDHFASVVAKTGFWIGFQFNLLLRSCFSVVIPFIFNCCFFVACNLQFNRCIHTNV